MLGLEDQIARILPTALAGCVEQTVGQTAAVAGLPAPIGAVVEIDRPGDKPVLAQVIGFRDALTVVYPLSDLQGVRRGQRVRLARSVSWLAVGPGLLGRVIDSAGEPLDGQPAPLLEQRTLIDRAPPLSTQRPRIDTAFSTGIRAIDALLTCGQGQRMGIFSGSGVGKSVLLGMLARHTAAPVVVVALVGERGREVNDFLERDLGPHGRAKSVVVVATSDEPAVNRVRAAFSATAIAEYFRDQGHDVLLLMDSLTRFAQAQREIGLAAGEPPAMRGYPPSVFALLPKLVERVGRSASGSITAFYSVLVEADDPNEPIGDAVRGLLDGHTWLSRKLAARGHYPAIDVLASLSRLMQDIAHDDQLVAAGAVRESLSMYREHEDLIALGAHRPGLNVQLDRAIAAHEVISRFLRQAIDEPSSLTKARQQLIGLIQAIGDQRVVSKRKAA
ncbi:MAG: FliI/YscN family ATPase [Pirellulales bacterium]|nr:FliI/YscN family ATPase [Pirellulales bacterium]